MDIFLWVLLATIIDSLVGLIGVFSLWIKESMMNRVSVFLMAFAAGALLGGAFFHLLPEAIENIPLMLVFAAVVAGFLVFQLLESYLHWHLCKECDMHPFSYLMIIGDGLHNILDGFIIAASFLISIPFGIVTTAIIILHEVPQEIGIFGSIVYSGQKRERAIVYTFLAQLSCVIGGIMGLYLAQQTEIFSAFLIPFAAGGFFYIAAADLVPEMHKKEGWERIYTFGVYLAGLLLMIVLKFYFEGA